MKVLINRLWNEPALASSVLAAVLLALGEAVIGDGLQSSDLPAVLAPLGVGGLTRQLVTPVKR